MAIYDNGMAPKTQSANTDESNIGKSVFNMSRIHHVSGIMGALMPIDVMETIPNEDYTLNYPAMIENRNPLLKPLKSGLKVIFHSYYMKNRDMWKGWDLFVDKGRDGTHTAEIPKYYPCFKGVSGSAITKDVANDYTTLVPCSPADYMGIPIVAYNDVQTNKNYSYTPVRVTSSNKVNNGYGADASNSEKWGLNALPFHMYDSICKHYYYNKNLLTKNVKIYPLDEDQEKIPFSLESRNEGYLNEHEGTIERAVTISDVTDGESSNYIPTDNNSAKQCYNALHFRQFRGDYFNTANPFPDLIRGNKSDLNFDLNADWSDVLNNRYTINEFATNKLSMVDSYAQSNFNRIGLVNSANELQSITPLEKALKKLKISGVTLSKLRQMAVLEKFMQRNATTDGSYKEFIKAQFGYTPNVHECKPYYIGGSTMDINCNEITSSATSGAQLLGSKGANMYGQGMNSIGKFHSDDYGYIMTIACIVPEVYYANQGLDTMWTRTKQNQLYYPLLNNLEPMAIKNKELFVTGNSTYDEDVWGYANIFEDMKSRRNLIGGLMACNQSVNDTQGWCVRTFDNNNPPQLNMSFLTMSPKNIDLIKMGFSSANEIPFNLTIGCCVEKVSPMPYNPLPADLGIKY